MRTVWKLSLNMTEKPQPYTLRGFEKVVHVAEQGGRITLWYLADPESTFYDSRTFQIFGTGDFDVPEDAVHLGSLQQDFFVWHVFEVTVPEEEA